MWRGRVAATAAAAAARAWKQGPVARTCISHGGSIVRLSSTPAASWRPSQPLRCPATQGATYTALALDVTSKPALDARRGPQLRPYQQECLDSILAALGRGGTRLGVSSPTGSGKTTIFSELIERMPDPRPGQHRVLILVSSIQLALQTAQHVARRYPSLWVEVEQGARYKASGLADVTIATWQTLISYENASEQDGGVELGGRRRRVEKFDRTTFKAVIVDEAHHAASKSWRIALNHFDPSIRVEDSDEEAAQEYLVSAENGAEIKTPIIGFSATFSRHDGLSLGSVFDEIVFHRDVLDLIDEDWLSPLQFTSIHADIPLDSVALSSSSSPTGGGGGDFQTASLARVVNTDVVNKLVVRTWLQRAWPKVQDENDEEEIEQQQQQRRRRRSTLIFAVNVQHVHDLTDEFRRAGIDARCMSGSTPVNERKTLLEDFARAKYPILVNCAILTEGADIPAIDCVLLARPTLSRNLFSQMIGRGMRKSPSTGKTDCLILDLVGNCSKGLVCAPSLYGLDPTEAFDEGQEDVSETSLSSEELMERRRALQEEEAEEAESMAARAKEPQKVTFVDWISARELQKAMSAKAQFGGAGNGYGGPNIESMSSNAWVDCGDEVYVLELPPNRGYLRIERTEIDEAAPAPAKKKSKAVSKKAGKKAVPAEEDDLGGTEEEGEWTCWYIAKNADLDEAEAAGYGGAGRRAFFARGGFGGVRRYSPYRRPRKVLTASTLEQALRGSDTFVVKRVPGISGGPQSLVSRHAAWRSRPASEKQRAFVTKRLGLKDDDLKEEGGTKKLKGLTRGQAGIILTRLQHGAKSRWLKEERVRNKEAKQEEKIKKRRARETVKVGPLAQT